jgi:hypothetical protein
MKMKWLVLFVTTFWSLFLVDAQDFEELNLLLKDALIYLGDVQAKDGLILDLSIQNARCSSWSVGDMNISSQVIEDRFLLSLDIYNLDMDCWLDFSYRTLLFKGSGGAYVESRGNNASTQFWVTGNPPVTAELETCTTNIDLSNLQIDGGILALASVEDLIARIITSQAQQTICQQLSELTGNDLTNLLNSAKTTLDKYPQDLKVDPLVSEKNLLAPHPKLLNLQTKETRVGELFQFALAETFSYLAQEVNDSASPTSIDTRANVLLRDTVLDEGALVLNVQDFLDDDVVWQNEDKLTDTTITLNSIQLFGLDTLTVFQPYQTIGNYTLQNEIAWEYLTFELNATINIKASRAPGSVIVNPGSTTVVEQITINFGVENVRAIASLLLAIDQVALESLPLGSLLRSEDLFPCLMSTIHNVEISGLQVFVDNIQEPTLDGFVSRGIDRICTNATQVAFDMYKPALLKSAPAFFHMAVRSAINKRIQVGGAACPTRVEESSQMYMDFRDLLLEPQAAIEAGGSGKAPYGDSMSIFYAQMTKRLVDSGDDGLPKINTVIRPATKAQSGVDGELSFLEPYVLFIQDAFRFESLVNKVEIQSTSRKVANLDSVVPPLQLFRAAGAHNLTNSIQVGRPLVLSSNLHFRIGGTDSPLAVDNTIELAVSFQSAVTFDIIAKVLERQFLDFPVKDFANVNCWLAALPAPDTDDQGNLFESEYSGLQLTRLLIDIEDLDFNVSCISCTSLGGEALPEILTAFKGSMAIIEERSQLLLNDMALSYWDSMEIHRHVWESRKTCPHSPYYDESWNSSFDWPSAPPLSRDAVESIAVLAVLATSFGMVLTAKSHLLQLVEPTNPLSGEQRLSEEGQLIDWKDLGGSVGEWAVSAFEEIRSLAGNVSEDEVTGEMDLGANMIVRELFEDGIFEVNLTSFDFGGGGIDAKVSRMRIFGLDSMLEAEILDAIGSRTLSNRMRFEMLRLEVDIEMNFETAETATVSFQLNNVNIDLALLLAVDWRELGRIKVGSVLQLKRILSCMFSKFRSIEITQLLVSADSIDGLQIDGFLSGSARSSLLETSSTFLSNFTNDLIASIPKVCDTTIREVLNVILRELSENEEENCSYDTKVSNSGTIDFRDLFLPSAMARQLGGSGQSPYGDTFQILFQTLKDQISAVDEKNQTALNDMFVRPMTLKQSNVNGSVIFPGEAFNASGSARLSSWPVFFVGKVSNARIENLDTVGDPLNLLQPVFGQSSVLNNSLSMGAGSEPLRLAATVYLSLSDDNEMNVQNEVELALDISAITFVLTVFLAMSESSFFALSLGSLQDINCWLSSISPDSFDTKANVPSLLQYGISAEKVNLNISCVSCGSPRFSELIEQLYSPGESQEETDSFVAGAEAFLDQFFGSDFLHNLAQQIVSDASLQCADSPDYDANATTGDFWILPETYIGIEAAAPDAKTNHFNVANAIVAAVLLVSAMIARFVIRRNNRKWLQSLPNDQVDLVHRQDQIEAEKERYLNTHTKSMFRSEQFPQCIRYAVPVYLLLNIGFYLVGHIALLSYVNIEAQIAGEDFTVERFLEFRFFEASLRTYRNGGSEMAIFLIVFSCVWPYIKIVAALVLWFVPPNKLSVARREKMFLWMDVLTKLSIIDILTMLLVIAVLFVYIGGPGQEFYNSDELYAMTLVVVPQAGFYCIVIAQRLNRVSSRFFLDYHDKIITVASKEYKRLHQVKPVDEESAFESDRTDRTVDAALSTSFSYSNSNSMSFRDSASNSLESPSRITTGKQESAECEEDLREEAPPNEVTLCDSTHASLIPETPRSETAKPESPTPETLTPESPTPGSETPRPESLTPERLTSATPTPRPESPTPEPPTPESLTNRLMCKCFQDQRMMGGTVAVVFACVFVVILFIIGCTLTPSLSLDVDEVLSIALESGRTFADAVNEFSVFQVVSLVLLKTRFVLSSTADYVGLGILLSVACLSIVMFPLLQGWKKFQEWRANRKQGTPLRNRLRRKSVIPGFTNRLKVWNHMEIFVISFCIASWQLCAVVAYVVHNYCDLLQRFYEALAYIGLVERTTSNCFGIQASDPLTLLILIGSFFLLLASFVMQMIGQYKKNKAHIEELLDEESRQVASF